MLIFQENNRLTVVLVSFMDTWTNSSLVFSWNINIELALCAMSYWLTISTESGSSSWTYPTYNWEYVASVHEGKKPFKCDICDNRCCQNSDMNKYVAIVHERKRAILLWHLWGLSTTVIKWINMLHRFMKERSHSK